MRKQTKNAKRITAVLMSLMCVFGAGCSNKTEPQTEPTGTTVADLFSKYNESFSENAYLPILNIEQNQGFKMRFKSLPESLDDVVTVYRDFIHEDNKVDVTVSKVNINRESYLRIAPKQGTDFEPSLYNTEYQNYWGGASSYYIAINYDSNSDSPAKLENPTIIPFTIASEIPAPTLQYKVDVDGNFSLFWDKVPSAAMYNIYHKTTDGKINCIATTQNPEYSFTDKNNQGSLVYTSHYITTQNSGISGKYFITSVFDNKESNFSNYIKIAEIGGYVPQTIEDGFFSKQYDTLSELPETVKVKTLSGGTVEKKVYYDFEKVNTNNLTTGFEVNYSVQDTELTGYIQVKSATIQELTGCMTMGNYNKKIEHPFCIAGYTPVQNQSTTLSPNTYKASSEIFIDVNAFKVTKPENYDKLMSTPVPEIPDGYVVFFSNTFEEYLVRHLFNYSSKIDLSLFPEANNRLYLDKTMDNIIKNNPFLLGIKSYSYNGHTNNALKVEYFTSETKTWADKQAELLQWVENYVQQSVFPAETIEKETRVYDLFVDSCVYDFDSLLDIRQNWYTTIDDSSVDIFNAYGSLIHNTASSSGYASAFKLLCDYIGIECKVVSGSYQNIPHMWNAVKIDDKWAYVDISNNYISSGIPYPVFNIGELPKEYKLSYYEDSLELTKDSGYYEEEGLSFTTEKELETVLKQQVSNNVNHFVLKNKAANLNNEKACELIAKCIHDLVPEKEFTQYFIGIDGDFIVISKTDTTSPVTAEEKTTEEKAAEEKNNKK